MPTVVYNKHFHRDKIAEKDSKFQIGNNLLENRTGTDLFHVPFNLTLGLSFFDAFPFIMEFFPFAHSDFHFCISPFIKINAEWNDGVPFSLSFCWILPNSFFFRSSFLSLVGL